MLTARVIVQTSSDKLIKMHKHKSANSNQ